MQLNRLVLPAPLGPINANNSPAAIDIEMALSTTSPPNLSVTLSTSSSFIGRCQQPSGSERAIIVLAVASHAEIGLLDGVVVAQRLGRAFVSDGTILQDIAIIGDCK